MLHDLVNHPEGVRINWSKFAREHNVPGKNGGQVVKQFAKDNNIDTAKLDQRPDIPRKQPRHVKIPGGETSSPCMPSIEVIKKERDELIAKGVLKLGEPVAPYSLTRFKTTNSGQLIKQTVTVEGRKIPMLNV